METRGTKFLFLGKAMVFLLSLALLFGGSVYAAGSPIVFGVPTALGSIEGRDGWMAIQMAVEEINAKGGVLVGGEKRPLEAYSIDTREHEPGIPVHDALTAVEKLILEKKPHAIVLGAFRSEILMASMDLISKYRLPYICSIAMTPAYQKKILQGYDKYKYCFRNCLNAIYLVKYLQGTMGFLSKEFGFNKAYLVVQDTLWAQATGKGLKAWYDKNNWEVGGFDAYPLGASDFSSSLIKVRAKKSQVIVPIFDMPQSGILLKQARAMKIPALLCVNKWDLNPEETAALERAASAMDLRPRPLCLVGRIPYDSAVPGSLCDGSPLVETPNIDSLAEQGMRFTSFYSAYCVCSASRASLMTGCYQPRLSMPGVLGPNSKVGLHPNEVTIADMLKNRNYATMCIGKWHLGDNPETLPTAQGFDHYFGLPYSNDMARIKPWGNKADDLDRIWKLKKWDIYKNALYRDTEIIESPVNQTTLTQRYTNEAVQFIRRNRNKPFFLYFPHTMVHVPLFVSDDRYEPDTTKAYKLAVEHVDWSVGRVLRTLEELGIADNTLIVYSSDNGPWLSKKHHGGSALPLRAGKGTTYEGGMRVPGIMRWPARIGQETNTGLQQIETRRSSV